MFSALQWLTGNLAWLFQSKSVLKIHFFLWEPPSKLPQLRFWGNLEGWVAKPFIWRSLGKMEWIYTDLLRRQSHSSLRHFSRVTVSVDLAALRVRAVSVSLLPLLPSRGHSDPPSQRPSPSPPRDSQWRPPALSPPQLTSHSSLTDPGKWGLFLGPRSRQDPGLLSTQGTCST